MIKLLSLKVKNFKSLYNTEIETFSTVNFFFGYNNSGKSNVFKFLKLLFEQKEIATSVNYAADDGVGKSNEKILTSKTNFRSGYILDEPYLFSKNIRSTPIAFEVALQVDNGTLPELTKLRVSRFVTARSTHSTITFFGTIRSVDTENSHFQVQSGAINGKEFFRFEDDIEYFFEGKKVDKRVGEEIMRLFDNLVLLIDSNRNFIKETARDGVSDFSVDNFKNALFDLFINAEKNDEFNKLIDFLSGFAFSPEGATSLGSNVSSFPFNSNTDLGFAKFSREIEIMLNNGTLKIPLKNFGTGIQQFLFILARIYFNKSQVVIIEELELNLSPVYQKELLRFLKTLMPSLYSQLLFSSHSAYFTQKDAVMVDVIHHVRIDYVPTGGTTIDSHTDVAEINDPSIDLFYFNED